MKRMRALRDKATADGGGSISVRGAYRWITLLLLLFLVGAPMLYYIWGSFWSQSPGTGGSFTLEGYRTLFQPIVYDTVINTLIITVFGTLLTLVLGVASVLIVTKTEFPGREVIALILITQYMLPEFIVAIAWEFFAGPEGVLNQILGWVPFLELSWNVQSLSGIIIVSAMHYAGLVYLLTSGAVGSIPASLEEAASLSGGSMWTNIRKIILPIATPAIVISGVLVAARNLQSFGIPIVLGSPQQIFVVATLMYEALSDFPINFAFASAAGMIILVLSLLGLYAQSRISGPREQYEVVTGGGEGRDTKRYSFGSLTYPIAIAIGIITFVLYILPFIVVFVSSFQQTFLGFRFTYVRWTLENYETLLFGQFSSGFYNAFINTMIVSGVGAFVGMVLASMASYIIVKSDSPLGSFLDFLTLSPAALPGIVVATAFLWIFITFKFLGLYGTVWIIMLALTSRFIVYGTRATNSSFRSIGDQLEEMGRVSGAGFISIAREILLPLIRPGFMAGYILLFIDYMKVLSIPLLLQAGDNQVLAVFLWRVQFGGKTEVVAALSMIMILMVVAIYGFSQWYLDADITQI